MERFGLRSCLPHLGHLKAESLTSLPHSGHLIRAIQENLLQVICNALLAVYAIKKTKGNPQYNILERQAHKIRKDVCGALWRYCFEEAIQSAQEQQADLIHYVLDNDNI